MQLSQIHVAVGIVYDAQRRVLITLRPAHVDHGGYWVFPGGKVERNETVYDALVRELQEEVGLHVLAAKPLMSFTHQYPDKKVLLDVWQIERFAGEAFARENQPMVRWVEITELNQIKFPAGNELIIDHLLTGI